MKAFQVSQHQHPREIKVSERIPLPIPKEGEILVDVYAAGLNFFDILMAQAQPPMPFVLGAEFAGKINNKSPLPRGCPYKPGDRVLGFGQGAYAETIAVRFDQLLPLPKALSYEQGAGIALTIPTSYEGLVGRGQAKKGEWVLVHAGAGGVGLAACQIAKILGCMVIATAGSKIKRDICIERGGADAVVDYGKTDWQKEVMQITGGKGVDVVFDPVGMIVPSLKCVAWNARLVVVGFAAGAIEKVPANLLLLKNVAVTGLFWGATANKDPQRSRQVIKDVMSLLESGKLVPQVFEPVYDGLESVARGLEDLEARKTWGKAVIRVRKEREAKL